MTEISFLGISRRELKIASEPSLPSRLLRLLAPITQSNLARYLFLARTVTDNDVLCQPEPGECVPGLGFDFCFFQVSYKYHEKLGTMVRADRSQISRTVAGERSHNATPYCNKGVFHFDKLRAGEERTQSPEDLFEREGWLSKGVSERPKGLKPPTLPFYYLPHLLYSKLYE